MCDCIPLPLLPFPPTKPSKLSFKKFNLIPQSKSLPKLHSLRTNCTKFSQNSSMFEPQDQLGSKPISPILNDDLGIDFIENGSVEEKGSLEDENLIEFSKEKEVSKLDGLRSGRRLMRRSNVIAKQVISIQSAISLGFVAQIWVDTSSWIALVVEVRPNLLSGESDRFLLEDVSQVGDVVLVQDESVMETEFRMLGLETLVGYNVVTPGRRNIGKVRGYTFDVNSGVVESLELDSFGISIIPSSLVSTYALLVEDVLEVLSDTVVVHETAASRIQRLTKGFWGTQKVGIYIDDDLQEYSDFNREGLQSNHGQRTGRNSSSRRYRSKVRETEEDWEMPIDYL